MRNSGLQLRSLRATALGCLLSLAWFLVGPEIWAAQSEPRAVVEDFHSVLLGVMQRAKDLGFEGRKDTLAPPILKGFDLPYIARIALGTRHWRSLSEDQQASMVDTFSRLSVATYASRFDGYSGERFVVVGEQPLRRGRALVRTELRQTDGDVVGLDYVLHSVGGEWRIVNVIADGVSDLALKRAEYGAVMTTVGFEALLAKLKEKIAEYETQEKPR